MQKKGLSESQIVTILKEVSSGIPIADICRKHGVGQSTYYKWKSKYGGMQASELKKLNQLERENQRLKQMYATLASQGGT